MSEPKLGQTKKSAVESYLRAKREKGQLTDEEIARLDAIGFKWEKRKKKTIEEKVDLYVHYWESGKRWRCNETGERFRSLDDAFRKYGKEGENLDTLRTRVRKGHTWHGMTIAGCQTERPITSSEYGNLTNSLKRDLGEGKLTEAQLEKLRHCDFPFESIKEAVGLDDRLRVIWDSEQNGAPDSLELQINKEYAWKCPVCGYRWTRRLGKERDSKGCPACLGKVVIPGWTDLATCNPDIAEEWDYEKNGNLTPSDITANSNGTYWFLCRSCGASYKSYPGAKEPLCMGCMRKARGRKNGKKVVCVETGTVYETIRDAGMQVGKHPSSISHAISDGRTCAGYHWKYLDE